MITTILFDFFDVIHRDHQKAWLAANGFERSGGFAEASDLLDRGEIGFEDYLQRYGELSGRSPQQVWQEFGSFGNVDLATIDIIERLHGPYKTALVSNAHSKELRPILERYDLERLFDQIFISSEVGIAKPDSAIFRHVADELAVNAADCLFIDDNPVNVAAAQQTGMAGIVFETAEALAAELQVRKILS